MEVSQLEQVENLALKELKSLIVKLEDISYVPF